MAELHYCTYDPEEIYEDMIDAYVDAGGDPGDPGALSFYSYQGFDIHDGAIYFYEGEGQYKSNKSHAYITVFTTPDKLSRNGPR